MPSRPSSPCRRVKRKYHVAGSGGARGYTPFGVETAKGSKHFDLKEFWHIGREIADDSKYRDVMAPNLWPTEVEGFRERGYGLYQALDNLGSRVLSALALHIGLPENFFADKTNFGNSILRPIHYPPITTDDIPNVRAGAHGDINFITLLVGASAAGLEVQSHDGEWVPFTSDADTIVVNIGDMLQRLTNHVYPSTIHRVVNPGRTGAPAALLGAVLPAPEPGLPDRRAALVHHPGEPEPVSGADHRPRLPRGTPARDQAEVMRREAAERRLLQGGALQPRCRPLAGKSTARTDGLRRPRHPHPPGQAHPSNRAFRDQPRPRHEGLRRWLKIDVTAYTETDFAVTGIMIG